MKSVKSVFLFIFFFHVIAHDCISQCISTFPYNESFETNNGGWVSGGAFNDWAWGVPSKPVINTASAGNKCWMTGGLTTSFYNYDERSYVQSPCFDFSALSSPHISFYIFWETEYQYDGASFQYSINNGAAWNNVGAYGDATDCLNQNWYNYSSINNLSTLANPKNGWSGTTLSTSGNCLGGNGSGAWINAKHAMPVLAGKPNVIFRFVFGAGSLCNNYDGFAFDNIVIKNISPVVLTGASQPAGCTVSDGTATVTVTGGTSPYNYLWNPPVSVNASAIAIGTGNYAVTVSDAAGCSSTINIQVGQSPDVSFLVSGSSDTCNGSKGTVSTTIISGTSPFVYQWSNIAQNVSYQNGLQTGNYSVMISDSKGCSSVSDFEIGNINDLKINLGNDTIICQGTAFTITPGDFVNYYWQDMTADSVYEISSGGIYFVDVTDSRGCTASDTLEIIEDCLQDIILPNTFSPNDDGINDFYFAVAARINFFDMKIYNRWGQLVFQSADIGTGWNGKKKNKKLPPGLYITAVDYSIDGINFLNKTKSVLLIR